MSDQHKRYKYSNVKIHCDAESRACFEWLRDNHYNASGLIKSLLKDKVAELKQKKDKG